MYLAPLVRKVIAVDREATMLKAARQRLADHRNVDFRQGDINELPLEDEEIDVALVFLVIHHVEDPGTELQEIRRVLRPGGLVLIVDMVQHDRETYRYTMAHKHLGFTEGQVTGGSQSAGLRLVRFRRLRPDTTTRGPGLFAAVLRKD